MGIIESLYDISPIPVENFMISLSGYQRNRSRYGRAYYEYRKFLAEFDKWSLERKLEYQRIELIKFINYAVKNSRFYRTLYNGIDISSIKSIHDLKRLPIVDKETLRSNINDIVTIPARGAVEAHTGGTTGKSLVVLSTVDDMMKRMAMLDHFKARVGFEHKKMRRATFNGKHIVPPGQRKKVFWRYNAACKQMIYSSFHLTEENLAYYVSSLNHYKPQAIDGFFTSICDVAKYIERHNMVLSFRPIAIFPTSETLTEIGRELLERVFRCRVYNQYASSEGAPFVTECRNQSLHMELSSGVIEHFEDSNDEIVVTSFTSHGTPLIRYRIGDSMVFDPVNGGCKCGMEGPIVCEIRGRMLDFVFKADGAKINAGNIANLFKNMPNALIRAQVVQEKIGEVVIKLEIDKNTYRQEYDDLLRDEFLHKFGNDTKLSIEHVDKIDREQSGKYRLVVNKCFLGSK